MSGFHISERTRQRLVRAVEAVEAGEGGGGPAGRTGSDRGGDIQLIRVTGGAPVEGHYPAVVQDYDAQTGTPSDLPDGECWAIDPGGMALVAGYYHGRRWGEFDEDPEDATPPRVTFSVEPEKTGAFEVATVASADITVNASTRWLLFDEAGPVNVESLSGGVDRRTLYLLNISATATAVVTLIHNATVGGLLLPLGADLPLFPGMACELVYCEEQPNTETPIQRWLCAEPFWPYAASGRPGVLSALATVQEISGPKSVLAPVMATRGVFRQDVYLALSEDEPPEDDGGLNALRWVADPSDAWEGANGDRNQPWDDQGAVVWVIRHSTNAGETFEADHFTRVYGIVGSLTFDVDQTEFETFSADGMVVCGWWTAVADDYGGDVAFNAGFGFLDIGRPTPGYCIRSQTDAYETLPAYQVEYGGKRAVGTYASLVWDAVHGCFVDAFDTDRMAVQLKMPGGILADVEYDDVTGPPAPSSIDGGTY